MVTRKTLMGLITVAAAMSAVLPAAADSVLKQMQDEVAAIVRKSRPAVVTVQEGATTGLNTLQQLPLMGRLFSIEKPKTPGNATAQRYTAPGMPSPPQPYNDFSVVFQSSKTGSGFSIGDGYVVTTADVLDGMTSPLVVTDDGKKFKASVVGIDRDYNVGLVKLQEGMLPGLALGDSDKADAGHFAISIGNQSGQENSVALMMISGVRTEPTAAGRRTYPRLLQMAGTVGAGVSGGPVLDADGRVIGIMAGVPSDNVTIQPVIPDVGDINGTVHQYLNSMRLNQMLPDTALPGVQLRIEGQPPVPEIQFTPAVPGQPIAPPVVVTPNMAPPAPAAPGAPTVKPGTKTKPAPGTPMAPLFNFDSRTLPYVTVPRSPVSSAGYAIPINDIKPAIEALKSGKAITRGFLGVNLADRGDTALGPHVLITGVIGGSPADKAGVRQGDVLVRLNRRDVHNSAEARNLILNMRPGDRLTLDLRRDNATVTINTQIGSRDETK